MTIFRHDYNFVLIIIQNIFFNKIFQNNFLNIKNNIKIEFLINKGEL